MKEKKIIALLTLVAVCLIAFNNESKAQNNAQIAKDKLQQLNSWDNVLRTLDTTPTTTTNQLQVQNPQLDQSNTRDNASPAQIAVTATITKAMKPPVKPNITNGVTVDQQIIDNVKAAAAENRVLPTQQQIIDLINQKRSGN